MQNDKKSKMLTPIIFIFGFISIASMQNYRSLLIMLPYFVFLLGLGIWRLYQRKNLALFTVLSLLVMFMIVIILVKENVVYFPVLKARVG
jgi:predicted membrane protein